MDMESLMAQAQSLQTRINEAQDSLAHKHVKGIAGNGGVVVDMTGKYDVESVVINPSVMANGAGAVSEMVLAAYKDAKAKADTLIENVMQSITGSMPE